MTEIIFSFDTEDFTQNHSADAIFAEAEILREAGIKGGFCLVGLLAKQLEAWGRDDVIVALSHHEFGCHSYGHSLHPVFSEYTDIEDFEAAYKEVWRQETEALRLIERISDQAPIYYACPPGNQKNYVAMYAYADMGIPLYADTCCDTLDGRGMFYCNIYQTRYTSSLENLIEMSTDEEILAYIDEIAKNRRAILYTHPNMAVYAYFWDLVNYYKENKYEFGKWEEPERRAPEVTERFYQNIKKLIRFIQNDSRFKITTYSELAEIVKAEPVRRITKDDIPYIKKHIDNDFSPISGKVSYSISDMFLACRDLLLGKEEHICGKVYGFLTRPVGILAPVTLRAKELKRSAEVINADKFLPHTISVGGKEIGPADWLRAALEVLMGKDEVTVLPAPQLPSISDLPELENAKGIGWVQSDDFKNKYITERLKLQCWTMRYLSEYQ